MSGEKQEESVVVSVFKEEPLWAEATNLKALRQAYKLLCPQTLRRPARKERREKGTENEGREATGTADHVRP